MLRKYVLIRLRALNDLSEVQLVAGMTKSSLNTKQTSSIKDPWGRLRSCKTAFKDLTEA